MSYTIQQVSKMTRIPATTLRYYDKEGLLPSSKGPSPDTAASLTSTSPLSRLSSASRVQGFPSRKSASSPNGSTKATARFRNASTFSSAARKKWKSRSRNGRKSSTSSITNASITRKLSKQERKSISSPRTNCPTQMNSSQPCLLYQILRHLKIESIKKSPFGIQISWTQREISIFTIHVFRRFLLSGRTSLVFLRGSVRRSTVLLRGFRG